jgi:hypothetical protein
MSETAKCYEYEYFNQGFLAAKAGEPFWVNPYVTDTYLSGVWEDGWLEFSDSAEFYNQNG